MEIGITTMKPLVLAPDYLAHIEKIHTVETRRNTLITNSSIDASKWEEWMTNALLNLMKANVHKNIFDLKDKESGPAIVIGAGPGLKKDIELLKEIQNKGKYVFIAVDRAFNFCKENGLMPDYTINCDSSNLITQYLDTDKITPNDKFVLVLTSNTEVIERCASGTIYLYTAMCPYSVLWMNINRLSGFVYESLMPGLCVGFSAIMLAEWLGSKEIYCVGMEYSWDEWSQLTTRDFDTDLKYCFVKGKLTHESFEAGALSITSLIRLFPKMKIYDCSEDGILEIPKRDLMRLLR